MKLSHIAMTILYLEKVKYKLQQDLITADIKTVLAYAHNRRDSEHFPIDYFLINEFPMNSALCYIFETFKIKGTERCFCPFSKSIGCGILRDDGKRVHTAKFILAKLDDIDINTTMKMLKRIRIGRFQVKLKLLRRLFGIIRLRKDFIDKYGKQSLTD